MAASDPAGGERFWLRGVPFQGLQKESFAGEKFWKKGLSVGWLFPSGAPPLSSIIKSINTVLFPDSVKKYMSVAAANIKKALTTESY